MAKAKATKSRRQREREIMASPAFVRYAAEIKAIKAEYDRQIAIALVKGCRLPQTHQDAYNRGMAAARAEYDRATASI
jgi:hypothetical protein